MDVFGYEAEILEPEHPPASRPYTELRVFPDDEDAEIQRVADVTVDDGAHRVDRIDFDERYVEFLDGIESPRVLSELEHAERAIHSAYSGALEGSPQYPSELEFVEGAADELEEYGVDFEI